MKRLIICFLTLVSLSAFAQDEVIPDLYGNKESLDKLKDKTLKAELATFTDAGSNIKSETARVTGIPLTKYSDTYCIFEEESAKFKIVTGNFNRSLHKYTAINGDTIKIDNKPFFGTDGELPTKQINSIFVIIGSDTVKIPKIAFTDLCQPSMSWKEDNETVGFLRVYSSVDKKRFYIHMQNSDGAGYYEVTFMIRNKKYVGRVIDYGF